MMAEPMRMVKLTIRVWMVPGKMWMKRMRPSLQPRLRATSTYKEPFTARVALRIIRAKLGTVKTATAMNTLMMPGPSRATMAIASRMSGKLKSTSAPRMTSISIQPP